MSKLVRVLIKSSGHIVSLEESAAQRMAKAAPQEYQVLELPKIEVTAIPEKKSAGLAGSLELNQPTSYTQSLNVGTAVPSSKKSK